MGQAYLEGSRLLGLHSLFCRCKIRLSQLHSSLKISLRLDFRLGAASPALFLFPRSAPVAETAYPDTARTLGGLLGRENALLTPLLLPSPVSFKLQFCQ
jgi:hypothetical protein